MKKSGIFLMLVAMLAVPVLACGLPLPAGSSMMAVSKATCAEGEAVDTCQVRQDAYELMSKLTSATVKDLNMHMYVDDGSGSVTEATFVGNYGYQVSDSPDGIGADLDATIETGEVKSPTGDSSLNGARFIVVGAKAYTSQDGGKTWVEETLDPNSLLGIGLLLGVGGTGAAGIDLFADPSVFAVTPGDDVEIDGQSMHVQTLTLDLGKLLGNAQALGALMDAGFAAGGDAMGLTQESLGMSADQVAMMSGMLLPFLAGTEISTTLYIGADDGYIHHVEEKYIFKADLSTMSPDTKPITMTYELAGDITQHNMPLAIVAPANATAGNGLLSSEGGLFGSGGLSGGLFGGQ